MSTPTPSEHTSTAFYLPIEMERAIIGHAQSEAPRECCGIIAGSGGAPIRLFSLNNVAEGNALYEIDPAQLIELEFSVLPELGAEIIAIYHSHPESPAYPSPTDIALAFWPDAVYIICSLANRDHPVVRAFRIHDETVQELSIRSGPPADAQLGE